MQNKYFQKPAKEDISQQLYSVDSVKGDTSIANNILFVYAFIAAATQPRFFLNKENWNFSYKFWEK